jgi:glycosyltransferase involved in cell wall biosynthesis
VVGRDGISIMRILYVSQYYPPEMGAPAARVHELSREWVSRGHRVTVLTAFPHHPTGIKLPGDRGVLTRRESRDGIDLIRTYVYAAPNRGILRRMVSYVSFMLSAVSIGRIRVDRPDVVIATSPQLLCGLAGYVLARTLGVPFVFEVRDLWPESILAVDAMGENRVVRGLKSLARFLYDRSDLIVTVGEGYRAGIRRLYGTRTPIEVVPNGVDAHLFRPGPRENGIRAELGWGDRFVLLYVGTLGMAHALDKVLEAARRLKEDRGFLFCFVGEGAEKERLKSLSRELQLGNVQFLDQQPKDRVRLLYAACDLGVVTLRDTPLFQDVLPSKIFEYLGMERPVVLGVGGEARALIEAAGAGEVVPPEDPEALVAAIQRLEKDRPGLAEMGRRGRAYVLEKFDRRELARRYLDILEGVKGIARGR